MAKDFIETKRKMTSLSNSIQNEPLSISTRSDTICLRTSTKSHSTVVADTTHTHSARAAARRTKGRERRLLVVRLAQGSPSSLDADSNLPPLAPPPPTNASNSRRFRIFFPTRSGTDACTALSIPKNRYRLRIRTIDTTALLYSLSLINACATVDVRLASVLCN